MKAASARTGSGPPDTLTAPVTQAPNAEERFVSCESSMNSGGDNANFSSFMVGNRV